MWNVNSVKPKKSKLANFLSINNFDTGAISETKFTPKHRFSMPGYSVHCADQNQFGGGVTLLVKNKVCHDQFVPPNVVNLETIAVCFYMHNNTLLLSVSCYNPPNSPILHSDLDSDFSSFDSVLLVSDLNCKQTAWNCISDDRNGWTLLSYCLSQNTAINYHHHPTYFHTNFQTSVLNITLSKHYILSKQLSVPALFSDLNPMVFKILLSPSISEYRPILDYAC